MKAFITASLAFLAASTLLLPQSRTFVPVTSQMLLNPSPNDWLMYNRTYDSQRYSPLKQIDKSNVDQLRMVWTRGQGAGSQEGIPLVHDGVMYLMAPGAAIQALDATNGNLIWEYQRKLPANQASQARSKTIAMGEDMIYTTTPDSFLVALDAKTGELRWETKTDTRGNISGAVIAGDKVISGGSCTGNHVNCYISAHDAKTGKLLWKFATAANTGEPGGDTWGDTPDDKRFASTWGEPGTYDPTTNTVIWGIANPTPNTRMERHGNPFGVPTSGPVDLFSDSTVAINADTGKLVWYYQHLAGDDWDEDWTNDRVLATTSLNPTAATAKWFNPKVVGQRRDVVIATGESGGVFAMDRKTGEFLWANPWPFDVPNFLINKVDPDGKVHLNESLIFTGPNQHKDICFFNTRSYWSQAYSPATNSLYVPWVDTCLDMQTKENFPTVRPVRNGKVREGSNPAEFSGVSKINIATGKIDHIYKGRAPINGAMLATASDLIFFGDLDRRLRALDATSGKVLWEQTIGGPIANSTITYAVNGQQYIAVATGDGLLTQSVIGYAPGLNPPKGANAIYVFALPQKK